MSHGKQRTRGGGFEGNAGSGPLFHRYTSASSNSSCIHELRSCIEEQHKEEQVK